MMLIRCAVWVVAAVVLLPAMLFAETLTVSKDGRGRFTTIQAAVDAAKYLDEVVVLDSAVYAEQVTIDSTKSGLVLRSDKPKRANKPTILFQDKINVGPATAAEAFVDSLITFYRNGALRILRAANVRIEGIAIDGGGVYPFGNDAIWQGKFPLQSGNAAITMYESSDIIVRDCDISHAFYGINVKDRMLREYYAMPNPADTGPVSLIPSNGMVSAGNHLVEYNRIHDNSFGFGFESPCNTGGTVRYNLIYENHHPTAAIAARVKNLSAEGPNLSGGAIIFKDNMLSPLAIHNNTFWHNSTIFLGNWRAGGQHLIFNNIYAEPNEYWGASTTTFSTNYEMSKCFVNRMHNCVYAAQEQAPTPEYTTITNDLKPVQTSMIFRQPALINPFPASAEIFWVETKFKSNDPDDPHFLEPAWSDPLVESNIIDQGWEAAGVKDPDGSRADLGAIPMAGERPFDLVTIIQTKPVEMTGEYSIVSFAVWPRLPGSAPKDFKIVCLNVIRNVDTTEVFGSEYKPIAPMNIITVAVPATKIVVGDNTIKVPVPAGTAKECAFFEMVIEGVGTDGRIFTSAVGFVSYHYRDHYFLDVVVLDTIGGTPVTTVRAGQPVVLQVKASIGTTEMTETVDPTDVMLQSRFDLFTPEGSVITDIPGGITGTSAIRVMFTGVPIGGVEFVHVAGRWMWNGQVIAFLGSSQGVTVLPGPPDSIQFQNPATGMTSVIDTKTTELVKVLAFDKYGNRVEAACAIKVVSLAPKIGMVIDTIQNTAANGISTHHARVTFGEKNQVFSMVASLVSQPSTSDTAYFKVGKSNSIIPPSAASARPRHLFYELISLDGRVLRQQHGYASRREYNPFVATVCRGIYFVRITDVATGKVTMRRRVVTGR